KVYFYYFFSAGYKAPGLALLQPLYLREASTASLSQRSFSGLPWCPLTHMKFTLWIPRSLSSFSHKSALRAGFLSGLRHPLLRHEYTQPFWIESTTYFESLYKSTEQGSLRADSPSI